jgi:hypothetical protein
MESDKQNDKQKAVPVYLSFKTFQSAIQGLRAHGLPSVLDRTAFGSRSGAEQTQILSAFKFLGLIDDANRTQDSLRALKDAKENSEQEKAQLAAILKERYANAFALNLEAATPAQLDKAIAEYGAGGSTKDRSVRFFLKALEHCGIKVSTRLTARKPRSSPSNGESDGTPRTPKGRKDNSQTIAPIQQNEQAIMTVDLPEVGGKLTISGTFNPFRLVGEERALVFAISDLMSNFQKKKNKGGN